MSVRCHLREPVPGHLCHSGLTGRAARGRWAVVGGIRPGSVFARVNRRAAPPSTSWGAAAG